MKKKGVKKTVLIILCSLGAVILAAFLSLFLISGIFVPKNYLEPWDKNYAQKFEDPRIQLAAHGLLAANGHNMQPWKIQLDKNDPRVFYLYADSSRMTNEVDPYSRQMMVTQGTFLDYVQVAGEKIGYRTDISLFPNGVYNEKNLRGSMDTKPVAKITLRKTGPLQSPLYNALFVPDTNRGPYKPDALTAAQISRLDSLSEPGLSVKIYQDKADVSRLDDYAMKGAVVESGVQRVMDESARIFRANEYQKNKYRYGFSVEGQGTSGIMVHLLQGLVTLFPSMNSGKAASDLFVKSTQASVDSTPAYVMIQTKDNSRKSQVKSGMLYSRLILEANHLGLAVQPLSQVLEEYPEMRQLYNGIHRDYAPDGGTIQMLVRIGKPVQNVPQTMRRDVMDLIMKN
ncbi:Acg family FMN-binding oxidoreductase [Sporolactobacillus putidus]|uniref:Nitroreductase domain-containing protein n=1 Tax=Sporolactobacillus putidus TaxID=492735 RepID=A0A917W5D8_9BACL|nr:nitroreductase family protein [Sporolactobacillus putidus]GGL64465.1 hypothetical protein GCM10007968_30460 [Sporolactobacillus putidus]